MKNNPSTQPEKGTTTEANVIARHRNSQSGINLPFDELDQARTFTTALTETSNLGLEIPQVRRRPSATAISPTTRMDEEIPLMKKSLDSNVSSSESSPTNLPQTEFSRDLLSAAKMADTYDKRFASGAYEGKFDKENPVPAGEYRIFNQATAQLMPILNDKAKNSQEAAEQEYKTDPTLAEIKPLNIIAGDFGCGDGRSLELWEKLAKEVRTFRRTNAPSAAQGATLTVTAGDISQAGIAAFIARVKNSGFTPVSDEVITKTYQEEAYGDYNGISIDRRTIEIGDPDTDSVKITQYRPYRRDNLEIRCVHIDPNAGPSHLKKIFGENVDMMMVLYGSTSHIYPESKHDDTIKELKKISELLLVEIPGITYFKTENDTKKLGIFKSLHLGPRGVLYVPSESPDLDPLYFAIFTHEQLKELMDKVGATEYDISISSLANPSEISKSPYAVGTMDFMKTAIANCLLRNNVTSLVPEAGYWGVTMKGEASKKDASELNPLTAIQPTSATQTISPQKHEFLPKPPPLSETNLSRIKGISHKDAPPPIPHQSR